MAIRQDFITYSTHILARLMIKRHRYFQKKGVTFKTNTAKKSKRRRLLHITIHIEFAFMAIRHGTLSLIIKAILLIRNGVTG
jgi:hypothetical protein